MKPEPGSFILNFPAREQDIREPEIPKIVDSHGIKYPIEMVALMLHNACMEAFNSAIDRLSTLIEPSIA